MPLPTKDLLGKRVGYVLAEGPCAGQTRLAFICGSTRHSDESYQVNLHVIPNGPGDGEASNTGFKSAVAFDKSAEPGKGTWHYIPTDPPHGG